MKFNISFQILIVSILLGSVIALSFIETAYPQEKDLNYDTLSILELDLLSDFLSQTDPNKTIILAQFPTWRYIMGLLGDWPPKTATFFSQSQQKTALWSKPEGKERIHAFEKLVYKENAVPLLKLAFKENVRKINVIILHRYSTSEATRGSYSQEVKSLGEIILSNPAGYVLEYILPDTTISTIPIQMDGWKIRAVGITTPVFQLENNTIIYSGNFSDRGQAVYATKEDLNINLTKYPYFAIKYSGESPSRHPRIRIFLIDNNNEKVEIKPDLYSTKPSTTQFYDLSRLSILNTSSIILSLDSGSAHASWSGPGIYIFHIEKIWFSNLPFESEDYED